MTRVRHTPEALATRIGLIGDALFWHRAGVLDAPTFANSIADILSPSASDVSPSASSTITPAVEAGRRLFGGSL